jgi:hypothetical protein
MKYYKDANGAVYAFESDGSQDAYIPDNLTAITNGEADALRAPTTGEMIAAAHSRINGAYESAVNALTAGYPDTEIASWPKQEGEARAYLANNAALTPWIDGAAALRGLAKADLVALIIGNADALAPIHGAMTGKRQSLRDAIDALGDTPTQEQLDVIVW